MGKNFNKRRGRDPRRPAPRGSLARCLSGLNYYLGKYNRLDRYQGRLISHETRIQRANVLEAGFRWLNAQNYRLNHPRGFRGKHFIALLEDWLDRGLAPSTIATRISIYRTFCEWINKPSLVDSVFARFKELAERVRVATRRTTVATEDHSWEGNDVDPTAIIARVAESEMAVAVQMALQHAFGLRVQESMLLRPYLADQGCELVVLWGTKGGRPRRVSIETDYQRQVLAAAKDLAPHPKASTIPSDYDLRAWRYHYYYVVRKHGISRKELKVVSHGLRHGFAHRRYRELSWYRPQVTCRNGPTPPRKVDNAARLTVAHELGHGRKQITNCYLGSSRGTSKVQNIRE